MSTTTTTPVTVPAPTTTAAATTSTSTSSTEAETPQPAGQHFVFPDADLNQAQQAQAAVDQGHQPWRLDPTLVASAYGASLGWDQTTVSPVDSKTYDITPADGSTRLRLTLSQPIRQDQTGIWEILTSTRI